MMMPDRSDDQGARKYDHMMTAINGDLLADFVFYRQRHIEQQEGFLLAGMLVTKFPKSKPLKKRQQKLIRQIIEELTQQVGHTNDDTISEIWLGPIPPDAPKEPPSPEEIDSWAKAHICITVRVNQARGRLH